MISSKRIEKHSFIFPSFFEFLESIVRFIQYLCQHFNNLEYNDAPNYCEIQSELERALCTSGYTLEEKLSKI
jgi:hypothetical protein